MSDSFPFIARKPPRGDAILRFIVHYGLLLVLALVLLLFSIVEPAFLRVGNLFIILQSVSIELERFFDAGHCETVGLGFQCLGDAYRTVTIGIGLDHRERFAAAVFTSQLVVVTQCLKIN